jgi:hypothetical protein
MAVRDPVAEQLLGRMPWITFAIPNADPGCVAGHRTSAPSPAGCALSLSSFELLIAIDGQSQIISTP